jgi:hypothetical protein
MMVAIYPLDFGNSDEPEFTDVALFHPIQNPYIRQSTPAISSSVNASTNVHPRRVTYLSRATFAASETELAEWSLEKTRLNGHDE